MSNGHDMCVAKMVPRGGFEGISILAYCTLLRIEISYSNLRASYGEAMSVVVNWSSIFQAAGCMAFAKASAASCCHPSRAWA